MKGFGGIVGIGAAVLVAAGVWVYMRPDRPDQVAFDKAAWDAQAGCARATMVEDLTRKRLPPGLGEAEIVGLLGTGQESIRGIFRCREYDLGRCGGGPGSGGEAIAVCFDGNGRLAKVWAGPR